MTATLNPAGPAINAGPAPAPNLPPSNAVRKPIEIAVLVGPAIILFLGFVILPVILAAVYSLYNLPPAFRLEHLADP